jgi:hypothetical protein
MAIVISNPISITPLSNVIQYVSTDKTRKALMCLFIDELDAGAIERLGYTDPSEELVATLKAEYCMAVGTDGRRLCVATIRDSELKRGMCYSIVSKSKKMIVLEETDLTYPNYKQVLACFTRDKYSSYDLQNVTVPQICYVAARLGMCIDHTLLVPETLDNKMYYCDKRDPIVFVGIQYATVIMPMTPGKDWESLEALVYERSTKHHNEKMAEIARRRSFTHGI